MQRIPYSVEMATRNAIYGRPGAHHLDMPDDIITGKCDEDKMIQVRGYRARRARWPPQEHIQEALNLPEKSHGRPSSSARARPCRRAEDEVCAFIGRTQIPFLRSPMRKSLPKSDSRGVMPDNHPLSVAAARTLALQNADLGRSSCR